VILFPTEMTSKAFHAWIFPVLSLAVGLGYMKWFGDRYVPFMGLLMGPPDSNSLPAFGIPALVAGVFGFFRPKPKGIWSYGFLMWMPQLITSGKAIAFSSGFALVIAVSAFLAAVVSVLASCGGFALRKIVNKIGVPEQPPSILRK
jgi:hypothetical protein